MAVEFICDCCGASAHVEDAVDEVISPPKGWRKRHTVIVEYVSSGGNFNEYDSEHAHSCADCNEHMTIDEHIEAEAAARLVSMRQGNATDGERPLNLVWRKNWRDFAHHSEWTAPCGCAYHPEPRPHIHQCNKHKQN